MWLRSSGQPGYPLASIRPAVAPGLAARTSTRFWCFFLLLHGPLAMALKASAVLATVHALSVIFLGLVAIDRFRTPEKLLYILGYIVASEPLWRASDAMIFWESGKFAVTGLSVLALFKFRLLGRSDKTALLYFLLLVPSILVLPRFDREAVSFNLSGPLALATSTLLLSTLRIPTAVVKGTFLAMLGPILGLASVATFSTLTTDNIDFYASKVASAGLGPNQASSVLAFGGLLAFLYLCIVRRGRFLRWLVAAVGIWCTSQGALTFSRGGIATTIGAVAAASFFLLQDRRTRGALVLRIVLIVGLAAYVVVPVIDSLAGGALRQRFSSTHLTGRDKIIEADLIAFRENPVLGVGPGQSKPYHARTFRLSAAHTEYSRLLAEHGSFGLLALLLLGTICLRRTVRRVPLLSKAFAAALTVWALLFMFHAAMRMAVVSFVFALGGAVLMEERSARAAGRSYQRQATALASASPNARTPTGAPGGRVRSSQ